MARGTYFPAEIVFSGSVTLTSDLIRRLAALWLALALQASLLAAPFHHVHEPGHARQHVAKHHSGSLAMHLHFAGRYGRESVWTPEVESSARPLGLFRVNLTDPVEFAIVIVSEGAFIAPSLVLESWIRDSDHRIHDPPRIGTRSPRAPPV
jgi:hypothetical protein